MQISTLASFRASRRRLGALAVAGALAATGQPPARAAAPSPEPNAAIDIFLSPLPPVLGDPLPSRPLIPTGGRAAPTALALYVNEPFYAPLSTRLERNEVGDDLDFRLQTYRTAKTSLQAELRAHLDTLKYADPGTRQHQLAEFAREQTPRIAALEEEAEKLRADLCRHGSGLSEYRRWQQRFSGVGPVIGAKSVKLQILDFSRYYREDISPDQRRLLGEIVAEQVDKDPGSLFYLSPEPARMRLPSDLPATLAAEIAAYRKEKVELENELMRAMFPPDPTASGPARAAAMQALQAAQAARVAELEASAESIRTGLAALNDPARSPDLPALSPELGERIANYRADKLALQKALLALVEHVKQGSPSPDDPGLADRIRDAIADFTRKNAARYAAVDRTRDSIRADLARLAGAGPNPANGSSPDALLAKFSESRRQLETYWDYRDYQTAVLQPGLSPPQRRLLFDGAVEKLALPLPEEETPIDPH